MPRHPVSPIDPAQLEKMKEEVGDLLGRAPEDMFSKTEAEAASLVAAGRYEAPEGKGEGDPEDLSLLLKQAFAAIGREVPNEMLDNYRATHQPIVDRHPSSRQPEPDVMTAEEYREQKERIRRKYQAAQASVGTKRLNMLRAIADSPKVFFLNREDRWLQINGVKITVPEGNVAIPKIIADFIDTMDATRNWVEREKRRAQQYMNIERPTSFVKAKVDRFAVY